jgi:hypothetical protein
MPLGSNSKENKNSAIESDQEIRKSKKSTKIIETGPNKE